MSRSYGFAPIPEALDKLDPDGALTQIRNFLIDLRAGRVAALVGAPVAAPGAPAPAPAPPPGPPGPVGPPGTPYVPDLTPPPTPSGVVVSAGLNFVFITTDAPTFSEGNGYSRTIVYGATYTVGSGDPLPTFGDAVIVHEFVGQVGSFSTPPGTQWHIWLKWRTRDAVLSVSPAGGANGHQVTTSLIGNSNLGPLIIEAGNLADGSVTAAKVAAQAVGLTAFAAGIEPVGIVGALPSPMGYSGPLNVLLTTDGKLYRYVSGAWTKAVDGTDLVANSVTTGSIAAGAINATQIAAEAIRTRHLLVGDTSNAYPDPDFQDETVYTGDAFSMGATAADGGPSLRQLVIPIDALQKEVLSPAFAVEPGKAYMVSAWMEVGGSGTGNAELLIDFYSNNAATTLISTTSIGTRTSTTPARVALQVTAPATTHRSKLRFRKTGGTRTATFSAPTVRVASDSELIVDGSVIATKLAANSIAVGTAAIQNGAIVNAMIANATISDAKIVSLAASKITAGSIAVGEYIQSSDFVTGVSGWRFGGNTAELGSANLRGLLTASQLAAWSVSAGQAIIANATITGAKIASATITDANIASLNADKITAGSIRGINVNAASHTTKGSYLTSAASGGATTLNVKNTTDFPASGSGWIIDTTNDRDAFSWTGKTATTLTGCSGVLAHNNGATIIPAIKNMVIDDATNEMRFFGNRGDGSIAEIASIGIATVGADTAIIVGGNEGFGFSQIGVVGRSEQNYGVYGSSINNFGVRGTSSISTGVVGASNTGIGVTGSSSTNYGAQFSGNSASGPLRLVPQATAPISTTDGQLAFLTTPFGVMLCYTAAGAWRRVLDGAVWDAPA